MKSCVICQNDIFENIYSGTSPDLGDPFDVEQCKNCKLIRTKLPENFDFSPYYTKKDYYAEKKSVFNLIKILTGKYLKVLPLEKYKNGGNLLDIGSGDGEILKLFKSPKWNLFGIEPYGSNLNDNSMKIHETKFDKTDFENKFFDLVSFWHVLEHVENPHQVLQETKRIIKDDGVLFISIPNSGCFGRKFFGSNWFGWYLPVHVYHYDIKSLTKLLKQNGFEIIKIDKFTIEYGFGMLAQSLLNLVPFFPQNSLYKAFRGKNIGLLNCILVCFLAVLSLPLLLLFTMVELIDPNGSGVINVFAKPTKG